MTLLLHNDTGQHNHFFQYTKVGELPAGNKSSYVIKPYDTTSVSCVCVLSTRRLRGWWMLVMARGVAAGQRRSRGPRRPQHADSEWDTLLLRSSLAPRRSGADAKRLIQSQEANVETRDWAWNLFTTCRNTQIQHTHETGVLTGTTREFMIHTRGHTRVHTVSHPLFNTT